jgi:protoheme IX farnesyltransferase
MSLSTLAVERRTGIWTGCIADYIELSKPRIATLVLVVVACSAYVARWGQPATLPLLCTLFGTLLVAASASALNQLLEIRRDGLMPRTASRPLPARRVGPVHVLMFASLSLVLGLASLLWAVNWPATVWAAATWFTYAWIYTPLKPVTAANTMVGAVSGAMPVFIGWSAAGGTLDASADPRGWALFLILFLWQFPHFMAIAWMYRSQYAKAGLRMLTVVDPSGRHAGLQAATTSLILIPVSLVPVLLTAAGGLWLYLTITLAIGAAQLACALAFCRQRTDRSARRLLHATLLYLPLLLACLAVAAGQR